MTNKRSGNGAEPGFGKGKSGNPARRFGQPEGNPTDRGGRPKSLKDVVRAECGEGGESLIAELRRIAMGRARNTVKVAAIRELLDRGFGKPSTPVELSGPGGRAIEISDHERQYRREFASFMTDEELDQQEALTTRVEQRMRDAGSEFAPPVKAS